MSAETYLPRPIEGGFANAAAISSALDEVTFISRIRGQAHGAANLFRDMHVGAIENRDHELRQRFSNARSVMARWALINAHHQVRTLDLARVENAGDWDATERAQIGIDEVTLDLLLDGQTEAVIERTTPEARRRITLDPTIVSADGLIAVRRKRLMLATRPQTVKFVDIRPSAYYAGEELRNRSMVPRAAEAHLEVDKVSEFILDIKGFAHVDSRAAAAVRRMAEEGLPREVTAQLSERVPAAIETAIDERHPAIVPAVTTYYADRKYAHVRELETDSPLA